jgi:DNA-binding NtrC family response regulator
MPWVRPRMPLDTALDPDVGAVVEVASWAATDVAHDASMPATVRTRVAGLARLDVPVLLSGPSDTRKTRIARMLHATSSRAGGPLFEMHLRLIRESYLEPELFGQERGALCGPPLCWGVRGVLERARGGTVVLCDVDVLPISAQAHLARLLQTGRYRSIGRLDETEADVRVVATTRQDLARLIGTTFRSDLYEMLAAHEVALP